MYLLSLDSVSFAYIGRILNILRFYWMLYMYIFEMWHFNKLLNYYLNYYQISANPFNYMTPRLGVI